MWWQDVQVIYLCSRTEPNSIRPPVATLVVMEAHKRVLHNGVKETLAELQAIYWLVWGRQFVQKLIHSCIVWEGTVGEFLLPEFHIRLSRPFQTTRVDFVGPLHISTPNTTGTTKVWLCLYTFFDLVSNMTATSFLRSFKRFTARSGMPWRMISDNAKTLNSAATILETTLDSSMVKKYSRSQKKLPVSVPFRLFTFSRARV